MYRDSSKTRSQVVEAGRLTWELRLNSLKSGNISVLLPRGDILITKTGRSLRALDPRNDLTVILHSQSDRREASCEFHVHRAIYQVRSADQCAILHCHPPHAIAASSIWKRSIPPGYNEARDLLGATMIVDSRDQESLGEDPAAVSRALISHRIVAVRGHGTFALGTTLEDCVYLTNLLESSCRVLFLRSEAARFPALFPEASPNGSHEAERPIPTVLGAARK